MKKKPTAKTTKIKKTTGKGKSRMNKKWYEILEMLKKEFESGELTRVFLSGPPGVGKSTWPVKYMGAERMAITKGTTSDHLLGIFTLQDGQTVWVDGPAVKAMRNGHPLVLDEIVEYSEDVEAILHALCDDPEICAVQLTNGEIVRPKKGFMVFAATNGRPDQLGEALRDRFEIELFCREPHPGALQKLSPELRTIAINDYSKIPNVEVKFKKFTVRQLMAFPVVARAVGDEDLAAWILWQNMGKEFVSIMASNRVAIQNEKRQITLPLEAPVEYT